MSEPKLMTEEELQEIRETLENWKPPYLVMATPVLPRWVIKQLGRSVAHIDALTAERDKARQEAGARWKALESVSGERFRLMAERDAINERLSDEHALCNQVMAERDRLRGALIRYLNFMPIEYRFDHSGAMSATQLGERDMYRKVKEEARAALRGDMGGESITRGVVSICAERCPETTPAEHKECRETGGCK